MRFNSVLTGEYETTAVRDRNSYAAPCTEEIIDAEILTVARFRDSFSATPQTVISVTTSTSDISDRVRNLIERQQETLDSLQKWHTDTWRLPTGLKRYVLNRLTSADSSDRTFQRRESSVAELIAAVRTESRLPFSNQLAERLEELVEISQEEFPEQAPVSGRSLSDFTEFLCSVPDISEPDVILTYDGNIRAEWTKSSNKHFAVEFLGDSQTRFVVFSPDPRKSHITNRVSGLSTLTSLLENVAPYSVLNWVANSSEQAA